MILDDFILQIFADGFPCLEYIYFLFCVAVNCLFFKDLLMHHPFWKTFFKYMRYTYLSKHIACFEEKLGSVAKEER